MKSFAEFLPTMTAREREIVEAFAESYGAYCAVCKAQMQRFSKLQDPLSIMRQTPPAKEPESVVGRWTIVRGIGQAFVWEAPLAFKLGDRVRITKIEGDG